MFTPIYPPPYYPLGREKHATHERGNTWRCWYEDYSKLGYLRCKGSFDYGTKECPVCGRTQTYPQQKAPKSDSCCTVCRKQLSAYLDAYHGRDPEEARKCSGCRK